MINAAEEGHLQVIEFLLSRGANIHAQDDRALINAAEEGHLQVVEFLVNHGADVQAQGDQALINASDQDHTSVIEFLVSRGANLGYSDPYSRVLYQHFIPQVISTLDYYRLEPIIENIELLSDRFLLIDKNRIVHYL